MLGQTARPARRLLSTAASATSSAGASAAAAVRAPITRPDAPPPSALAALLARLSLPPTPANQRAALVCLTHPSYASPDAITPTLPTAKARPASATAADAAADADTSSNALLAVLGNSLLGLFASEHLAATYPHMPTTALKAAVTSLVGPAACVSVARALGVGVHGGADAGLAVGRGSSSAGVPVRWRRLRVGAGDGARGGRAAGRGKTAGTWEEGVASVTRALVGLVYQEQGMHAARAFAHAHFLSRELDLAALLSLRNPKHVLSHVVAKHLVGAGAPGAETGQIEARVLATSAPASPTPLFSVGLFLPSGLKLAEGAGASKHMAEHRAATNALHSIFFARADAGAAGARAGEHASERAGGRAGGAGRQVEAGEAGAAGEADDDVLPSSAHADWAIKDGAFGGARAFRGRGWGGDEPLHGLR